MDAYSTTGYWAYVRNYSGTATAIDASNPNNVMTGISNYTIHAVTAHGTNTTSGYKNPKWRDQVRLGQNATTPFQGVKFSGEATWASYESSYHNNLLKLTQSYSSGGPGYFNYPTFPNNSGPPASVIADVNNRAIAKFIGDCNSALSSNNLTGRSIRHLKHDLHSLIHPMNSLRDKIGGYLSTLEKASKGVNKRSKSWLHVVRTEYLAFTFGTAPFVEDITSILVDASHRRLPVVPVSGRASRRWSGSAGRIAITGDSFNGWLTWTTQVNLASTYSVQIKGAIRTESGMNGKIGFIQSQRLSPSDWLPTIFSILPYAWMVDYFTNIGDIVDALTFPFSSLTWSCKTTKNINSVSYSQPDMVASPPVGGYVQVLAGGAGGNATFTYEAISRDILQSIDLLPTFELKVPTSPKKWLNMMAVFQPRIFKLTSGLIQKL